MQFNIQATISFAALLLSLFVALSQFRDRRQAKFNIEKSHIDNLLMWHREVVLALVDLRDESIDPKIRSEKRRLLSTLIEQGRFYFPNFDRGDGFGKDEPTAYRGYRHLTLDFLVAAFNLSGNPDTPGFHRSMKTLQRHFTSMIFATANPPGRLDRLRRMTGQLPATRESYEQFLSHQDAEVLRSIWG